VTKLIPGIPARAWLEVDLAALVRNARRFRELIGAPLLPMVKANGYGLGAVAVARALESADPWGYGVATVEEAAELRSAGIARPLLVFTPLTAEPAAVPAFRELGLRPVIADLAALESWIAGAGGPFHVEIDTGMSRSGFPWRDREALGALGARLAGAAGWEGVFTHFHSAETDPASSVAQMERFREVLTALPRRPSVVHFANSAAAGLGPGSGGDLARPGIFLYGGGTDPRRPGPEPVARLRARVVAVRKLQPGDSVSYGAEWTARIPTTVATLSIGYADGVLRSLSNRGLVELNGVLVSIAGRVTMDMLMVDAGNTPVAIGDVASLFGGSLSLDEQAVRAGTNSYELLTAVSARVSRVYLPESRDQAGSP